MSIFYASLRLFLTLLSGLLRWRQSRAEKAHVAITTDVQKILAAPSPDPKKDELGGALRQIKIGALASRQERAEEAAMSATRWAEWATGWRDWFAGKKGVVTPYVIAVADVALAWYSWAPVARAATRVVTFVITSDPGVPDATPPETAP